VSSPALSVYNAAIRRGAFELCLAVFDLRLVFNAPQDYANPIEPSSRGGAKIAGVAAKALGLDSAREHGSRIWR
jgi:hypothetical protein